MTLSSLSRIGAVLAVLALLGACSSAGRTTLSEPKLEDIPADKVAALDVKAGDGETRAEYVQAASRIREQLPRRLVADGIFRSVEEGSDSADYEIDVTITKVDTTSPGARVMLGAMAPRSGLYVSVRVRNTSTQKLVTSFSASGFGSRMWMSAQGYGLDDPVREVISQIVKALR